MDPEDIAKVKRNLVYLVTNLRMDEEFMAHLEGEGILTTAMVERLKGMNVMSDRASNFFTLFYRRGPRAFEVLVKTCVHTNQEWIAETLDPELAAQYQLPIEQQTTCQTKETKHATTPLQTNDPADNIDGTKKKNNDLEPTINVAAGQHIPCPATETVNKTTPLKSDPKDNVDNVDCGKELKDAESVEECEFTPERLLKLSKKFTKKIDLHTLAIIGLRMSESSVDGHIDREDDVQSAAYYVLKEWRNSRANQREAYVQICEALRHKEVNMAHFIVETLK